jgi:hypothetical protein
MEDKKYSKLKSVFEATQPQVPDDFTKRVMKRIEEQTSVLQSKRHRVWFYPTIAVAASVLLLISLGIVFSNQSDEGNNLVAQTDTTIVNPQTGAKEVETRPQEKKGSKEMADTVKRVKEILHMSKPSKHYMAKAETAESTPEPELMDTSELAERAFAEEMRLMRMMVQMQGNLQADFKGLTDEIRSRGERMSQHVEMALNEDEW